MSGIWLVVRPDLSAPASEIERLTAEARTVEPVTTVQPSDNCRAAARESETKATADDVPVVFPHFDLPTPSSESNLEGWELEYQHILFQPTLVERLFAFWRRQNREVLYDRLKLRGGPPADAEHTSDQLDGQGRLATGGDFEAAGDRRHALEIAEPLGLASEEFAGHERGSFTAGVE